MSESIERIREALHFVPASDRDTWLKMGMAIKSEVGDAGFDLWEAWSQQDESFDLKAAQSVWKSIRSSGKVSVGTLFHEAKAHGWSDDGTHQKPTAEKLEQQRRTAAERAAKEEADIARERAEAAKKATAIWKAATPATGEHPYLKRKQVSPVPTLREIDADAVAAILGYAPKSSGDQLVGRLLVVPVKVGDAVSTCELIDGIGRKTALYGGAKAGGYWAAQPLPEGDGAGLTFQYGEGVATTLSAKEANGHVSIAALSAGNLPAVAKYFHQRYPAGVHVVLADLMKATGAPDPHAIEAAQSVGGLLAIPDFGDNRPEGATDFNDMAVLHGTEAVRQAIEAATLPNAATPAQDAPQAINALAPIPTQADETEAQIIARLAKLSLLEYDRVRVANAERLNVRPTALDAQVRVARKEAGGEESLVEHTEPHPRPVVVADILNELRAAFNRHAILPANADVAMSLWTAFTWFIDGVHIAPLLIIRAPESECGKTTVKDVVQQFVRRPLSNEGVSIAALFRVVEQEQPTLLLDDADSWLLRDPNDERHSLINSGHKRGGRVLRCVGDNHDLKAFSTFCAKVIAFIGKSKDTLHNRSIEIVLRRKMVGEKIIPLRNADRSGYDTLRAKLARMEEDYLDTIANSRPDLSGLDNRAADNWEPLLAVADLAGGEWPRLARHAALSLLQSRELVVSTGVELLADIERIFAAKNETRIRSNDLQVALCADEEAGWKTYNRGREITPKQISKRLGEYSIQPKPLRFGLDGVQKGYALEQFQDAFARYLHPSPENAVTAVTELQTNSHGAFDVTDKNSVTVTPQAAVTPRPSTGAGCNRVTGKTGEMPEDFSEGKTESEVIF